MKLYNVGVSLDVIRSLPLVVYTPRGGLYPVFKGVLKRVPWKGVYALKGCLCPERVLTSNAVRNLISFEMLKGFKISPFGRNDKIILL